MSIKSQVVLPRYTRHDKASDEVPVFAVLRPVSIVVQETGSEGVTKRNWTPLIKHPLTWTPPAATATTAGGHETNANKFILGES